MPYSITQPDEWVEIGGVPLSTPAWECTNLHVLWNGPAVRGQDRILPSATGVRTKRRRPTITNRTLELVINGRVDWEGVPYGDVRIGLWENVAHLRENVTDPLTTSPGTRLLVLHAPDGQTYSNDIHVEAAEFVGDGYADMLATIDISIPDGSLEVNGS